MRHRVAASAGVTLIELLISIVVISIAVAGVLLVFSTTVGFSADAMREQQASAIAQAYLEEILLRPYADPTQTENGGPENLETRATFDDVQDYHLLSEAPTDQDGNALPNLADYTVNVTVSASGLLGPAANRVPAANARLVSVTVTTVSGITTTMSAYRANY